MDKEKLVVLIVDDSATIRLLTSDALIKSGFMVVEAENGARALTLLATVKPDVILLDVEMPGLDGFEVCAQIRKLPDHRYTPIMMITGVDDYESINKAFTVGATDFATKPIKSTLIGYRVRYMVRTSAYFQELQLAERKVRALNEELINKLLEIQQNAAAVARFVPQDFLKVLNRKNIADIKLGDCVEKIMTVLFLDIKSFTSLAEELSSVEIFNLVNCIMTYLNPSIVKNSGFIDKYIGDAIMALFEDADLALSAALGMLAAMDDFNKQREKNGLSEVHVGIGINTGSMIVGTVGFESRMDCSVISDAVNIASRVESLTRNFGIELLISGQTYQELQHANKYHLRSLGVTLVKGKSLPINIYEVFDHNSPDEIQFKKDSIADFAEAINYYEEKRYAEAADLFQEVIRKNPDDSVTAYFLKKSLGQLES
ncbi:MAG: response regulator [Legionella sp.]|uniref:response regulator n=1 Tax=Legionella sp. TaxID=459 RepID=UPI0039E340CC